MSIEKVYDQLTGNQAPAVIGKPVFEKDMEMLRACGVKSMADFLGHRESGNEAVKALPINFGSKAHTSMLSHETRMRLFQFKQLFNAAEIQAQIMTRSLQPSVEALMATPIWKHHLEPMCKAFNITDFSSWIPTVNARFYFEEFEIPFVLANEFDQQPMDSATVHVPGVLGLLEGKEESDNATFDEQSNTSSGFDVTARGNVVHTKITEDLQLDSAPAIIEKLRKEVVAGIARSYERAILNGDTTGTPRGASHMDSDIAAVSKHFSKAFKGMRKLAFDNSANGSVYDHLGDTASKEMFRQMLKRMGKMGVDKADLRWVLPVTVSTDVVTGAIPELFTAYAFGGLASNVTGKLPPIFGVQGIESQYAREDLNATGVYASGSTLTNVICFKRSRFANYVRQAIRVWAAPSLPSSDMMLMTAKMRHAFAGNPQSDKEKSVVMAINVATV
jgi:hypothetical protein